MSELSENPAERSKHYIALFEKTFQQLVPKKEDTLVKAEKVKRISDMMERYLQDARHYLEHNKPSTSLAAVAYAEGLLDALKFLELVET